MSTIQAVLFDLDGTLLDTAPDLVYALNCLRQEHDLPSVSLESIRALASLGSKAMLKRAFDLTDEHERLPLLRERFFELYQRNIANNSSFFPEVDQVLDYLDTKKIPWGIVTNKLTHHTLALLKELNFLHRPACIVCGDSLSTNKPDPAPILYACELLKQTPENCVYIGDAETDVKASKAAGTRSLVALYGYIHANDNPLSWQADGYVKNAGEIINWLS